MAIKIPGFSPEETIPTSYDDLFDQLPKDTRFNTLGRYQSFPLEQFDELCKKHADIAITIPTGRGKTLVALLLGHMHRLRSKKHVLYLCPNKHLVSQVEDEARDLGIPARDITGSWRDNAEGWVRVNPEARDQYTRNKCIGIATYSSVFNSNPLVPRADLILMDDAHAASEAVISPWCLELERDQHGQTFQIVEGLLRKHVDKTQLLALGPKPTPGTRQAQLVPHRAWLRIVDSVENALNDADNGRSLGNAGYAWRLLKGRLDRAFCFLSPDHITLRSWTPASFENQIFAKARHRVYFSATLEEWGHLEHIFGISSIKTIPGDAIKEPGRRLVINAHQAYPDLTDRERLARLVQLASKTLVLVSSNAARKRVAEDLKEDGAGGTILAGPRPEDDIEAFRTASQATLILANRYDGMNLGKGICRHIILYGKPTAVNVHEEFTTREWGLVQAGEIRARERVLQGMGRCTRGNKDHCLISLVGQELVSFLHEHTIRESLPPRIRAEVRLGEKTLEGLMGEDPDETLRSWVNKNEDWADVHAQYDNEQGAKPIPEQLQKTLREINRAESRFNEYLWTHKYEPAEQLAHKTIHRMESANLGDDAAAWYYLASIPPDNQEHARSGTLASASGAKALRMARSRGQDREWFGYLERFMNEKAQGVVDGRQVEAVLAYLEGYGASSRGLKRDNEEALERLGQEEAKPYHAGLRHLGRSLGFEATGDHVQGASDCVWHQDARVYINFEAKTNKTNDCLNIGEVNQIKTQLEDIAANDGLAVPAGLKTTCVTKCEAVASRKGYDLEKFDIVRPEAVLALAKAWFTKAEELHRQMSDDRSETRRAIEVALVNHGVTFNRLPDSLQIQPAAASIRVQEGRLSA